MSMRDNPAPELTQKQLRFVELYVQTGGANATNAAIAAGYSPGRKKASAGVSATRLLRDPAILAEIRKETDRTLRAGVALGASVLIELASSANSEATRLQAATALLDRGGLQLKALSEHRIELVDKRSDAELIARIDALQRELGLNAKVIEAKSIAPALQSPPIEIIPAEFEPAQNNLEGSIFD